MVARTRARRANPTQDEFIAMLSHDVNPETAEFVWFAMIEYLQRWQLKPHPDDRLLKDLPIDDNDPRLDWVPRYAELYEANPKEWPPFPQEWERTVRNFSRWLELGLSKQS
ncbi:MAG: hypothetical protein ACXWI1_11340 [Croceibacterium sp.]